jgi:gas vesicle protein
MEMASNMINTLRWNELKRRAKGKKLKEIVDLESIYKQIKELKEKRKREYLQRKAEEKLKKDLSDFVEEVKKEIKYKFEKLKERYIENPEDIQDLKEEFKKLKDKEIEKIAKKIKEVLEKEGVDLSEYKDPIDIIKGITYYNLHNFLIDMYNEAYELTKKYRKEQ